MAGRVLSEAEASAQVELDSGKRVKVKSANILIKFDKPAPADLVAAAQAQAQAIELDMAYEFAPDTEFGFADLARDYFSANATLTEQAGMLFKLFDTPHYFRRAGKGRFKKAPADIIAQALAAIEKKRVIAEQIVQWATDLGAGTCPEPIKEQLYKILFKPDKNAPEYKAVVEASRATHLPPLALLQKAGLDVKTASSGVSDGVQSLITSKYPQSIFCAIETSGDGKVNVQSRVQMFLFKARLASSTTCQPCSRSGSATVPGTAAVNAVRVIGLRLRICSSMLATWRGVKARLTSLRIQSCSGGSMKITIGKSTGSSSVSGCTPCVELNVAVSWYAFHTSSNRLSAKNPYRSFQYTGCSSRMRRHTACRQLDPGETLVSCAQLKIGGLKH